MIFKASFLPQTYLLLVLTITLCTSQPWSRPCPSPASSPLCHWRDSQLLCSLWPAFMHLDWTDARFPPQGCFFPSPSHFRPPPTTYLGPGGRAAVLLAPCCYVHPMLVFPLAKKKNLIFMTFIVFFSTSPSCHCLLSDSWPLPSLLFFKVLACGL